MKMKKMSSVCDYFVIASGTSTTQVRAIAEHISRRLKERGQRLYHSEGLREASWVLLDYGDVVVHLFLEEARRYYDLEGLWRKAPRECLKQKRPVRKKLPRRKKPVHKPAAKKRKR